MSYRVLTDVEKEQAGYCRDYSVLVGPGDWDCVLTEPEDRNWGRDGRAVVALLNAQHEELCKLRAELKGIGDAGI